MAVLYILLMLLSSLNLQKRNYSREDAVINSHDFFCLCCKIIKCTNDVKINKQYYSKYFS